MKTCCQSTHCDRHCKAVDGIDANAPNGGYAIRSSNSTSVTAPVSWTLRNRFDNITFQGKVEGSVCHGLMDLELFRTIGL